MKEYGIKKEIYEEDTNETCPTCQTVTSSGLEFKLHQEQCFPLEVVLKFEDVEVKQELSAQNINEQNTKILEIEQQDARILYPDQKRSIEGTKYFQFLDQTPFTKEVISSVEIMEKSCFPNLNSIPSHLDYSSKSMHYCKNCDRYFNSQMHYAAHLYAHTFVQKSKDLEPVICSGCGEEFCDQANWKKHSSSTECVGLPKTLFGCVLCKKLFTRKDNFRSHLKNHTKENSKKKRKVDDPEQECETCRVTVYGQNMLSIHNKKHRSLGKFINNKHTYM